MHSEQSRSQPKRWHKRELTVDLAAFLVTVLFVHLFAWNVTDLIWGIWLSSLCYTMVVAVLVGLIIARAKGQNYRTSRIIAGVLVGYMLWSAVGGLHVGHGVALHQFFPLVPASEADGGEFFEAIHLTMKEAMRMFWPFALATLVTRFRSLILCAVRNTSPEHDNSEISKSVGRLVPNVVVMHLLIFVFAILHFAGVAHLAIYPVLVAYFFPWETVFKKKTSNQDSFAGTSELKEAE